MDDDNQKNAKLIGVFMTIPFVLAVPPVIGWFIGKWLDTFFNTEPYLMYLFLVLGFASGVREFMRLIKRFGNGS